MTALQISQRNYSIDNRTVWKSIDCDDHGDVWIDRHDGATLLDLTAI